MSGTQCSGAVNNPLRCCQIWALHVLGGTPCHCFQRLAVTGRTHDIKPKTGLSYLHLRILLWNYGPRSAFSMQKHHIKLFNWNAEVQRFTESMWSDFCGKVMSFPVSSPRLARVPVCIFLVLYCFIVQHGSYWELHLVACLDKGFLHVFTIIVSSVGCSAPATQEEFENDDWPLSSSCDNNGGAGEAKSQRPRVKDGIKSNVGGNKLVDL